MAKRARTKLLGSVCGVAIGWAALAGAAQAADAAAAGSTPVVTSPRAADPTAPERIVVFGRSLDLTGEAISASEGVVGYADFSTRPLLRVGELIEVMPGAVATQHSGGGKANQYFLRGFNLDHGSDLAGSIDGIPLNLNSHAHMSGYLDINFIIPEVIRTVEFTKGPQHADKGDHSIAGAAAFNTYDSLDQGFVGVDIESEDFYRFLVADSHEVMGDGSFLYAVDLKQNRGPFELDEDLEYFSGFAKLTLPLNNGATLRIEGIGYDSSWYATDQVPLRAVESGLIDRFGYLDPDLGGSTHRYIAAASLEWDRASILAYAGNYALDLYGNPTFYLDQENGDQFVQLDRRWSYGAVGRLARDFDVGAKMLETSFGLDLNVEDIGQVGLLPTIAREPTGAVIRDDAVDLFTAAAFVEASLPLTDKLRATASLRTDFYDFDVSAFRPENSGSGSDSITSPKFSLAYAATDALELYGNYGYGYHSNDVRGVVITTDPATGDPADPVDLLVEGKGGEVGFRIHPSGDFNVSAALFALELDSESIFVGDAGTSEPSGGTERSGLEINGFWQPLDWLALDGSAAWSHARFADVPADEERIPNSVDFVASLGATAVWDNGVTGSFRIRHLGESALVEDNSVRSDPTTIANLGLSYDFGRFEAGIDVLNLFDSDGDDISYFYESQLLGEPEPVEDIHFHPVHPRSIKLVLRADL